MMEGEKHLTGKRMILSINSRNETMELKF